MALKTKELALDIAINSFIYPSSSERIGPRLIEYGYGDFFHKFIGLNIDMNKGSFFIPKQMTDQFYHHCITESSENKVLLNISIVFKFTLKNIIRAILRCSRARGVVEVISEEHFYVGQGIILDDKFTPLVLTGFYNALDSLGVKYKIAYINPCVFNKENKVSKAIVDHLIPAYIEYFKISNTNSPLDRIMITDEINDYIVTSKCENFQNQDAIYETLRKGIDVWKENNELLLPQQREL